MQRAIDAQVQGAAGVAAMLQETRLVSDDVGAAAPAGF